MWQIVVGAALAALLTLSPAPAPDPSPPTSGTTSGTTSVHVNSAAKRFWVKDEHRYTSPWYAGSRRKMIGFGCHALRIRNHDKDVDVVIGHVRRVYVDPGDRVRRGQLIARASDAAAPDGCHLHFEVRPIHGGYESAVRPHDYLRLSR